MRLSRISALLLPTTRPVTVIAAASFIVLAACASRSGESGQARADCVLTAADSAYLANGPLFRECAVDTPAKAISNRFTFNPSGPPSVNLRGVSCMTAEVEFVVGLDGRPEPATIRLIRSTEPSLGQDLVQSVPGWHYTPARLEGAPVRQIVRERRGVAVRVAVVSSNGSGPGRSALPPRCS